MKVVVQIGYMKSSNRRKIGQIVKAYFNDEELSWNDIDYRGKYLTSRSDTSKGMLWHLCKLDLNNNDIIKLEVKTSIVGAGTDEKRTFESLYWVDRNSEVCEIVVPGVGMKGYPLIKGRISELGSVSEMDKRRSDVDDFLKEGF